MKLMVMAAPIGNNLHFPKEEEIISLLKTHPSIHNYSYMVEKKVIEAVAKYFANLTCTESTLDNVVTACFYFIKKDLKIYLYALRPFHYAVQIALKDCALGFRANPLE